MSDKLKILYSAYQTENGSNGGVESATRIFESLSEEFEWTLFTNRQTSRSDRWAEKDAHVTYFNFDAKTSRVQRGFQIAGLSWAAFSLARRLKPDLIHANDIRTAQALLPIAKLLKVPFIYTVRDTKAEGDTYSKTWSDIAKSADRIVTLSDEMSDFMQSMFGAEPERLQAINSLVDLELFRPRSPQERQAIRDKFGIAPDEIAVGMVGVISPKKGQLIFLNQSWPAILNEVPGAHLHIVGDYDPDSDRYTADVKASAETAGAVTFHGFSSQISEWLSAFDIVLVPSQNEGLARCMIEAMACSTPVVSFDVCSAHEMLSEPNAGLVVSQADYQSFSDAVRDLAKDEQKRTLMGKAGRRHAESRFDKTRLKQEWKSLYERFQRPPETQSGKQKEFTGT